MITTAASVSMDCLSSPVFILQSFTQYDATLAASVSWGCLVSIWSYTAIVFSTRLQQRPLFLGILPVFILQSFSVRGYSNGLSLLGLPGLGLGTGKRKKSWTRAVFSNLQRKGKNIICIGMKNAQQQYKNFRIAFFYSTLFFAGLEKRFQIQKYITKVRRRASLTLY